MTVIFAYTEEQAIDDGVLVRIASNVIATTNLACTLAPDENSAGGIDLATLWGKVLPVITRYYAGDYHDAGATEYPDECDAGLACYLIDNRRVWIMPSYPGSEQVTIMFPEDY